MCGPVAGPCRNFRQTARRAVATKVSDPLFFQIVHVKPVIHDAVTRDVSLNVILHVFLELGRQIAQTQVTFLVVPGNDLGTRTFLRIFLNPLRDLVVGCAGGDQRTEIP